MTKVLYPSELYIISLSSHVMEINIKFQDGPIVAEIHANEEDNYEDVLEDLAGFVDNYGELTGDVDSSQQTLPEVGSENEETENKPGEPTEEHTKNPILANTGISESQFSRILKRGRVNDEDIHEPPRIIGNTDLLGESKSLQMLHAATIIVTVFDDLYGIKKVKTSKIKEGVKDSGINIDNWDNIHRLDEKEIYFDSRGRGRTATMEIRPPGKDKAYELIQTLTQSPDEDD